MRGYLALCLSLWLCLAAAQTRYIVIFDAGSSGTRASVFSWPERNSTSDLPNIQQVTLIPSGTSNKVTPGISSLLPSQIAGSLTPLMNYVNAVVPSAARSATPIYLMATGGMRLLAEANMTSTVAVLEAVRDFLGTQGYQFNRPQASIIPGEDEGVYGWLTINFNINPRPLTRALAPTSKVAIDLGGATMQLTFIPPEFPMEQYFPLSLSGQQLDLFTRSFVRYGKDQAVLRYRANLAAGRTSATIMDPCMWQGTNVTDTRFNNFLIGTGNLTACKQAIASYAMNFDMFCAARPCVFGGYYAPPIPAGMDIYAFSSFFFTADFWNCTTGTTSIGCVDMNANAICNTRTFAQMQAQYPSVSVDFLSLYCWDAAYMYNVLNQGFKIPMDRPINFASAINGAATGWTMGAALNKAGLTPIAMGPTTPVVSCVVTPPAPAPTVRYMVVIDAGSSSSKLNVFTWPERNSASQIPEVSQITLVQTLVATARPGVSSVAAANIASNLAPLINSSYSVIPADARSRTPIYLMATAGMRLLMESNPSGASDVLNAIRTYLATTGYQFSAQNALILPGELEGAYGWVTVNFASSPRTLGRVGSKAAIDMGGASMQMTFFPPEFPLGQYLPLQITTDTLPLYTHSWLRYGKDQAILRYRTALAAGVTSGAVQDPCVWIGGTVTDSANFPGITFTGSGNYSLCKALFRQSVLLENVFCGLAPCSMDGVYTPPIPGDMEIFAFSTFATTANFWKCNGRTTAQCIETAALAQCNTATWNQTVTANPTIPTNFLMMYCSDAAMVVAVLNNGFKLPMDRPVNFADTIGTTSISWAMGAAAYQAGILPVAPLPPPQCPPPTPSSSSAISPAWVLSVFIVVLLSMF